MTPTQFDSNEKSRLPARRQTENLPDGLYFFEDDLNSNGVLAANVITCGAWLLEIFDLRAGAIWFARGDQKIRAPGKIFAVFYPPLTITRPRFENAAARVVGIAGTATLPENIGRTPFVFEIERVDPPTTPEAISELLISSGGRQSIEACPQASPLTRKAKNLIDENFREYPSIARIAARLRISHAHLTRQFKSDFGLSPNAYLHQIRIADAAFRLARGEKIIDVSGEVGYNDLSRFYKQFRKSTARSPGVCRSAPARPENNKN